MTNSTIDLMHQHGSVRSYKSDPVPRQMIETITAAGQRASTSSNLQMYSVVVTTGKAKRKRLMELCGNQKHIAQAPVFMTWCADLSRLERVCQLQGYQHESGNVENFLLAAVDVSLVMQNAALAAESLGLGMCYIGSIRNNPQEVIDLLGLPTLVFPISGMTLGWPVKAPMIRPRLPLEAVLHWECYNQDDEAYLRAYDQAMVDTGIYAGRQVTGGGEMPKSAYGWLEHSARRVSKSQREGLLKVLQKSGFALK
ncbi:MAG: NADPH-dependent oxidoreductase [Anaerolineales bacterium]|nr:NADPH-dependent oxidoreductase [Anaerolineales bacterium]